ncbi:hypothetical protein KJ992_03000, partial [Patescibacteria group bacterium]|nr:hypothetical protein [Patescibacteria group bacterium]
NLERELLIKEIITTESQLSHYYGNCVHPLLIDLKDMESGDLEKDLFLKNAEEAKKDFLESIKKVLSEDFPESGGVTQEKLEEILSLAKSVDWTNKEQLMSIKEKYDSLKK